MEKFPVPNVKNLASGGLKSFAITDFLSFSATFTLSLSPSFFTYFFFFAKSTTMTRLIFVPRAELFRQLNYLFPIVGFREITAI